MPTRSTAPRPLCFALRLLGAAALLLCTACSTARYNRAWEAFETPTTDDAMVGRWRGDWESDDNGHDGDLRCMLTREEDGSYLARFHATYGWFFTFAYDAIFHVEERDGQRVRFRGEEDLGAMFGGVYVYEGTIDGPRFDATYAAENGDHGVFRLERVPGHAPADSEQDG